MSATRLTPSERVTVVVTCVVVLVWCGVFSQVISGMVPMVTGPLLYTPTFPASFSLSSSRGQWSISWYQEDVWVVDHGANDSLLHYGQQGRITGCSYTTVVNVTAISATGEGHSECSAKGDTQTVRLPSCSWFAVASVSSWVSWLFSMCVLPFIAAAHHWTPSLFRFPHVFMCCCAWLLAVMTGSFWLMEGVQAEPWVWGNVVLAVSPAAGHTWICWAIHNNKQREAAQRRVDDEEQLMDFYG